MNGFEITARRASIHGRVADELTRESLTPGRFRARLGGGEREAQIKSDGNFVFADLRPSPPDYSVELSGSEFQTRTLMASAPVVPAFELQAAGEDELHVVIAGVDGAQNRISFTSIDFLPSIRSGSPVIGAGGTTSLSDDLEGSGVQEAELASTAGLTQGAPLRIIRSTRLVLRPGPYYQYPTGVTLAAFRVGENTLGEPPLPGALLRIIAVNGSPVASTTVGGLDLFTATLPAQFMIGPQAAREVRTNCRGDAVFYFPGAAPITSITISVALTGYVTQTSVLPVQAGERSFQSIQLVRS